MRSLNIMFKPLVIFRIFFFFFSWRSIFLLSGLLVLSFFPFLLLVLLIYFVFKAIVVAWALFKDLLLFDRLVLILSCLIGLSFMKKLSLFTLLMTHELVNFAILHSPNFVLLLLLASGYLSHVARGKNLVSGQARHYKLFGSSLHI
jgi:hypothetical protein